MKFISLAAAAWCLYLASPQVKIIWQRLRTGQQLFPNVVDRQLSWASATLLLLTAFLLLTGLNIIPFY